MEGCDVQLISNILRIPRPKVRKLLQKESSELEVTKSLLNLLYNIVVIGSVPVSQTQKDYLDRHSDIVHDLLGNRSLKWKKAALEKDPALVLNIAASCPTAVGSSSQKTLSNSSAS